MKSKIELYNSACFGLIIPCNSGVVYSNQTGGTSTLYPEVEGVYVPLHDGMENQKDELRTYFVGPKWRGHCDDGIDEETASYIDTVLQKTFVTRTLKVDREKMKGSHEAWVWVNIINTENGDIFTGFDTADAVLTWENSD